MGKQLCHRRREKYFVFFLGDQKTVSSMQGLWREGAGRLSTHSSTKSVDNLLAYMMPGETERI